MNFRKNNLLEAENEIKKYPKNKKLVLFWLYLFLVQKQNDNWIPLAAIKYVAKFLGVFLISKFMKFLHFTQCSIYHL